jgi:nitronate monooxygenase
VPLLHCGKSSQLFGDWNRGRIELCLNITFRTQLCDLLGIEYPIIQSGMGSVAGAALTAAVSNAGGLGIIGGATMEVDELRAVIREVKGATSRPFGVNLLLPAELRPPVPLQDIADETVRQVQCALNPIRKTLGLAQVTSCPAAPSDTVQQKIAVILEEDVPVFSIGLGNPEPELVETFHRRGTRVIAMVTNADEARAVEASGVDAVVAQGAEAGGHRSHFQKPERSMSKDTGTITLVPEVVKAVKIPVIAAGGITDGAGVVAAIALGAEGVMIGSRFITTQESIAPQLYKKAVIDAASDGTTVTDALSGRYARVLKNKYTAHYAETGAPTLPLFWQTSAAQDIFDKARQDGNAEYYPLWAGQSVGSIRDYPAAGELVRRIISEAHHLVHRKMAQTIKLSV